MTSDLLAGLLHLAAAAVAPPGDDSEEREIPQAVKLDKDALEDEDETHRPVERPF